MKKMLVLVLAIFSLVLISCAEMAAILPQLGSAVSGGGLTTEEIIAGLKEALVVGAINSTGLASKTDGFNLNSAIKIPFPLEAIR